MSVKRPWEKLKGPKKKPRKCGRCSIVFLSWGEWDGLCVQCRAVRKQLWKGVDDL